MENSKITIRIDRKKHLDLKKIAIDQNTTLNQVCLDLIYSGLSRGVVQNQSLISLGPLINIHDAQFVEKALNSYQGKGLRAILKTERYVADYVLIFIKTAVPSKVQVHFQHIVQALYLPDSEFAPSPMWIDIAQKHDLLWNADEEEELIRKLDQWST